MQASGMELEVVALGWQLHRVVEEVFTVSLQKNKSPKKTAYPSLPAEREAW